MFDHNDIGSAADEPADVRQLQGGNQTEPTSGKRLTLFSLLKFIALELRLLNENLTGKPGE